MLLLARLARRLTGRLRGLEPLLTGLRRTSGGTRALGAAFVVLTVAGTAVLVSSGSEADRVVAAAAATTAAGSARAAVTTVVDGGVGQPKQRVDAAGVIDFVSGREQYDVRVGAPSADLAGAPSGLQMVVVRDGTDEYSRLARWPRSRAWVRHDAGEGRVGVEGIQLDDELRALRPGMRDLRDLGTEVVRGVETTHLSLEVDLLAAAAAAGEGAWAEGLRQLAERVPGGELTVEVWLDERVHRLRYEMRGLTGAGGGADAAGSDEDGGDAAGDGDGGADDGGDGATGGPTGTPAPTPEEASGPVVGPAASVVIVVEFYEFGLPVDIDIPSNVVSSELTGPRSPEPSAEPPDSPEAESSPEPSDARSAEPPSTEPSTSSAGGEER